jgi:hypothetical protein
MRITESKLRRIVREEISSVLLERCHSAEDGRFQKCIKDKSIYSQTKGSQRYDSKYDGRGVYRGRKEDGTPKLSSKYGSQGNEEVSGGRIVYNTGKEIKNPRYFVGDRYKKKYLQEIETALQAWLASQDSNKYEPEVLGEDDACKQVRAKAYQQGLNASLNFIRNYEASKKGE